MNKYSDNKISMTSMYPLTGAVLAASIAFPVSAQEEVRTLEEILVTANKREESLLDVSASISAFDADMLDRSGIADLSDLSSLAPGLSVNPDPGGGGQIYLRSVGTSVTGIGADPNVALYRDGIYVNRHVVAFQDFIDIERVEVLRGPQGTLYGRNATGGAINVITKRPGDELEFTARAEVGNNDKQNLAVAVSGPLTDSLGGRLSAARSKEDSHVKNIFPANSGYPSSTDSTAVNGTLEWTPSDNWTVIARGDWEEDDGFGTLPVRKISIGPDVYTFGEGVIPEITQGEYERNENFPTNQASLTHWGGSLDVSWEGESLTFRSLTGYRDIDAISLYDTDFTEAPGGRNRIVEQSETFSQEFQLLSNGDGRLQWIAGAYYYKDDVAGDLNAGGPFAVSTSIMLEDGSFVSILPFTSDTRFDSTMETEAWALFGELNFDISERWRATVGLRYSDETKDYTTTSDLIVEASRATLAIGDRVSDEEIAPGVTWRTIYDATVAGVTGRTIELDRSDSADFSDWTPKFSLEYQSSEDVMWYITAAKGFKSGGFNSADVGPLTAALLGDPEPELQFQDPYDEETLWNYELGVKGTFWDGRARGATALFYYDYSDMQVQTFDSSQDGFRSLVGNGGEAQVMGFETEWQVALGDAWLINAAFSWMDTEFDEFLTTDTIIDPSVSGEEQIDLAGERLLRSPEFKLNLGAQYTMQLNNSSALTMRGELVYQDDEVMTISQVKSPGDPLLDGQKELAESTGEVFAGGPVDAGEFADALDGERTLLNLRLTWSSPAGHWLISTYVNNVTDENYRTGLLSNNRFGQQELLGRDRSYGLSIRYEL